MDFRSIGMKKARLEFGDHLTAQDRRKQRLHALGFGGDEVNFEMLADQRFRAASDEKSRLAVTENDRSIAIVHRDVVM